MDQEKIYQPKVANQEVYRASVKLIVFEAVLEGAWKDSAKTSRSLEELENCCKI